MMGHRLRALVMSVMLAGLAAGCQGGGSSQPTISQSPAEAAAQLSKSAYQLGSGDRIKMTVFRHEDLSGEYALDGAGNFAMPLVGEVEASGLTTRELEQKVATTLKQGYLVDPQVSVEVLNYRPFYILGEVKSPGSYPYVNGMTALNAAALAGGFTYRADTSGIRIKRAGSNTEGLVVRGDSAVLPGDVIEVPERWF